MFSNANCELPCKSNFLDYPYSAPVRVIPAPGAKHFEILSEIHSALLSVIFRASIVVFCDQIGHWYAKPHENTLSAMINEVHKTHLILLLGKIVLIDTNGIYPKSAILHHA
jgi:hypothetical protein